MLVLNYESFKKTTIFAFEKNCCLFFHGGNYASSNDSIFMFYTVIDGHVSALSFYVKCLVKHRIYIFIDSKSAMNHL